MAMEHKAFAFDYHAFDLELRTVLEDALSTNDCTLLVRFIEHNQNELVDPYEGNPLENDWKSLIEQTDAHQYGDFALTKYFDPTADFGLGPDWHEVQEIVASQMHLTEFPILGSVIGPRDQPFDPGKMGSYFQSEVQVQKNHQYLTMIESSSDILQEAIEMLNQAMGLGKGLYVTF